MLAALLLVAALTLDDDATLAAVRAGGPGDRTEPTAGIGAGSRRRPSTSQEDIVADIRVHGNAATSDDEVIRLAGIRVGMTVEADTPGRIEAALAASGRFEHVQVLKRFASIADPTQILLVIVVDEGPVKVEGSGASARIVRARGPHFLFLPVLGYEDGFGFSYGASFALPDPAGHHSQLAFPLTWGGDKRIAAQLEKGLDSGPLTRVQAAVSISRRTNPFFGSDDDRVHLSVRGEREIVSAVKVGATAGWDRVAFLGQRDQFFDGGVDVVVDTRLDPMLARNAVYARAAWDRLTFSSSGATNRTELEGRAYVGLVGQTILVVRAVRDGADRPLPPYLQPLLGGMQNLRGFAAGHAVGDTLVAGSTELRVPLTSPLSLGKVGVSAFVDAGTVYKAGERFRDQTLERGVGGGVWFSAAVLRLNLDVAHGAGGSTRVHFGTTLTF
jgi:outer membrane protein assembly factor BamA